MVTKFEKKDESTLLFPGYPRYPIDEMIIDDNRYQSIQFDIDLSIDIDNRWPIDGEDSCGYRLVFRSSISIDWIPRVTRKGNERSLRWKHWVGIVLSISSPGFPKNGGWSDR